MKKSIYQKNKTFGVTPNVEVETIYYYTSSKIARENSLNKSDIKITRRILNSLYDYLLAVENGEELESTLFL